MCTGGDQHKAQEENGLSVAYKARGTFGFVPLCRKRVQRVEYLWVGHQPGSSPAAATIIALAEHGPLDLPYTAEEFRYYGKCSNEMPPQNAHAHQASTPLAALTGCISPS